MVWANPVYMYNCEFVGAGMRVQGFVSCVYESGDGCKCAADCLGTLKRGAVAVVVVGELWVLVQERPTSARKVCLCLTDVHKEPYDVHYEI
jgi:hypothetical protein